jgi:hypothetical protein
MFPETESNAVVEFSYYNEFDGTITNVNVSLEDGKAEYLPNILKAFASFLRAQGFTYVQDIEAISDNGIVHSSSPVSVDEINDELTEDYDDFASWIDVEDAQFAAEVKATASYDYTEASFDVKSDDKEHVVA